MAGSRYAHLDRADCSLANILLLNLINQFIRVALLQTRPQDLPAHPLAMWLSALLAFLVSLVSMLNIYSFGGASLRSALALAVSAAFLFGFLALKGRQLRFNQAFTAICGGSAVVYVLALPLMPYFVPAEDGTGYNGVVVLLVLLLDIWTLVVTAFVFHHTFDIPFGRGIGMALLLVLATLLVVGQVPEPASPLAGEITTPLQSDS